MRGRFADAALAGYHSSLAYQGNCTWNGPQVRLALGIDGAKQPLGPTIFAGCDTLRMAAR